MAQDRPVTLALDTDMLVALGRAARAAGASPSDYVRACLARALADKAGSAEAALRLALAQAEGWVDLQGRLRRAGFVLRQGVDGGADGGLTVHSWPRERPLMPLSALGISTAALTLRYGAVFPPSGLPAPLRPARPAIRAA